MSAGGFDRRQLHGEARWYEHTMGFSTSVELDGNVPHVRGNVRLDRIAIGE